MCIFEITHVCEYFKKVQLVYTPFSIFMIHIMQLLILLFLLPSLIFSSTSLYKKVPVSQYKVQSSKQANTLIHCGGICKSKSFCTGFAYDEICELVTQASLIGNSQDLHESDLSLERIYIDTSIEETKSKYSFMYHLSTMQLEQNQTRKAV